MRFLMLTIVSFIFILEIEEIFSDDVILQKSQFYDTDVEPLQEQRKKKPFCNAFTGCGRKRSDDTAASIDEMTGRSLEELVRPIRFWEFIQKLKEQIAASREPLYPLPYGRKRCGLGNYMC